MLFTLEALQAKHGDSLILHYGDKAAPRFIVIDGGPATVYKKWLGPRLEELRKKWGQVSSSGVNQVLPIDLLMVSHIDDDHINGVLALFDKLDEGGPQKPYQIATLWHNAFDDLIGNDNDELRKAMTSELASAAAAGTLVNLVHAIDTQKKEDTQLARERVAVAASVPQGQRLRDAARKMNVHVNCLTLQDAQIAKTRQLICAPQAGSKFYEFNAGLKFCILGPAEARLAELQKEWAKAVQAAKKKKQDAQALAAAYLDKSAFNLSSIVVVAEVGGKRMLLTGDARGDYVLEGLKAAKLLKQGKAHFDLLKVMHHGSQHNVELKFFQAVTADHYVISADGKHDNPDIPTLQWIAEARGSDKYLIHLTNRDGDKNLGKKLTALVAETKYKHLKTRLKFRDDNAKGMKINLLDPVKY